MHACGEYDIHVRAMLLKQGHSLPILHMICTTAIQLNIMLLIKIMYRVCKLSYGNIYWGSPRGLAGPFNEPPEPWLRITAFEASQLNLTHFIFNKK